MFGQKIETETQAPKNWKSLQGALSSMLVKDYRFFVQKACILFASFIVGDLFCSVPGTIGVH